ncbi:MAG: acyl-CoA dehydrogenase family protein [Flectobacillus sp.]|uniref:acyl-CoA dehydrogenase family protein n=1 Tax=Flectobacillus sp. TaxID=50419 RepID=UPI003B999BEE
MNFSHSPKTLDLTRRVEQFIQKHILPIETLLHTSPLSPNPNWKEWQLDSAIEDLKTLAKKEGLWNLFLPEVSGLSNTEYAPLAEAMGYSLIAPEVFNCNAPDTGNMEVLWKYGTEQQKETWLKPLLEGSIRSVFCMTEPDVASSDATNMRATINDKGDHLLINGTKWWSTGIGHPNCKIAIFMGLSNPEAAKHAQHSMVLVPLDTEGVNIKRMLPVFGTYDTPYGHGEVSFENVKVPKSNLIGGLGKGFEIAQGRLGPGRIHHCMRMIGASERALQLMIDRGKSRTAFGKNLLELGGNMDLIANARMEIDMARLLVMKTAYLLDTLGIRGALSEVSQIKVVAPAVACKIIDQAMQLFGGKGLSNDTPLAGLYAYARTLRLADGPDEVHRNVVAKIEIKKYRES